MEVYLVGGAVRDGLLGLPVNERDWVVVGATPGAMTDAGYRPVGRDFPVFLHPVTKEEHALARTERKTGPGYRGFEVHCAPDVELADDLRRRDLTINAMARDAAGALIDPYGGQADLEARLLRHVSEAFAEDPVRVLRVARFAARFAPLGFTVAPETNADAADGRGRRGRCAGAGARVAGDGEGAGRAGARRVPAGAARLRRPRPGVSRDRSALRRAAARALASRGGHRRAHASRRG